MCSLGVSCRGNQRGGGDAARGWHNYVRHLCHTQRWGIQGTRALNCVPWPYDLVRAWRCHVCGTEEVIHFVCSFVLVAPGSACVGGDNPASRDSHPKRLAPCVHSASTPPPPNDVKSVDEVGVTKGAPGEAFPLLPLRQRSRGGCLRGHMRSQKEVHPFIIWLDRFLLPLLPRFRRQKRVQKEVRSSLFDIDSAVGCLGRVAIKTSSTFTSSF